MALSAQMKVLARIDGLLEQLDDAGLRYVADRITQRQRPITLAVKSPAPNI